MTGERKMVENEISQNTSRWIGNAEWLHGQADGLKQTVCQTPSVTHIENADEKVDYVEGK